MSRMRIGSVWRKASRKRRRRAPRSSELRLGSLRARKRGLLGRTWT